MNPFVEKLRTFVTDEVMFNAVRTELLTACDLNRLFKKHATGTLANADLYDMGRAWWQAGELIEKTFKELEKYRQGEPKDEPPKNVV